MAQGRSHQPIKVVVHGALGRMGIEVIAALCREQGLQPVGAVDIKAKDDHFSLPDGSASIPLSKELPSLIQRTRPHVVVDFSTAESSINAARQTLSVRVNLVVGTTGLNEAYIKEVDALATEHGVGAFVAPNFALGAVLLLQLAREAARFFDYAEIIEAHHEGKIDAPSGTALAIARAMSEGKGEGFHRPLPEKESLPGGRGANFQGVSIHSIRMPGRMAHHEVILGTAGQTLSLRHDTLNRECYMPGVIMAIKEVVKLKGLVVGLDKLMGLR